MHILHFIMGKEFFQEGPSLGNQYREDSLLLYYLQYRIPHEIHRELEPELELLGGEAEKLLELTRRAEKGEPQHQPFEAWGRRVDTIALSSAWKALERLAVERGLLASGYDRKSGVYSRVHQFALLYLFHPSSAFVTCPLAMSDGVAKLLEDYKEEEDCKEAFDRITTRDADKYWLSGQWMTERSGGSDVGRTETQALPLGKDNYTLHGTKWFCSAIHTQLSVALARIKGDPEGSAGLSAFLVRVRNSSNVLSSGIQIQRLKDKLGTRALPTAEVILDGAQAKLLGKRGNGVRTISTVFNISRIYNSICATSTMRRALAYVKSYAKRREAFGKPVQQHILYKNALDNLDLEFHASFLLSFHVAYLFGKGELEKSSEEEKLLRLLIPIVKLYTGRKAPGLVSEAMELIGGAAYIEDTDFPRLFRDAQVFPIWEGTTNILSLDMLRALEKEKDSFKIFCRDIEQRLAPLPASQEKEILEASLNKIVTAMEAYKKKGRSVLEEKSRILAFSMGDLYGASLLLEFSHWCEDKKVYPALLSLRTKISSWINWNHF